MVAELRPKHLGLGEWMPGSTVARRPTGASARPRRVDARLADRAQAHPGIRSPTRPSEPADRLGA
ncbi:hypothetical protein [Subtercola endophyticus]|uniref:hypothetical protein n=1 Tax=Subtercola endophyticus TaxID=2895559 RepID=UPI001E60DC39|nr:hypothetical protein [Subtercola endophyticus]UFS60928.1 hypothetical protein LQ955_09430 [Subtercola endophyticus]